jgi:hypothetical protein
MAARVLTVSDLAKYFGTSKKRACEMLRREGAAGFPCFQVGGGWCVDLDEMRDWICQQIEAGSQSTNVARVKSIALGKRSIQ